MQQRFRTRTRKILRQGTHRSQQIDSTLRRVSRLAPVMGITRVANVTGLDLIGIPVVMVCRPNSRSVAVSQGKGIDLPTARVSGLMEAAELYHAETTALPLRLGTYEELRYRCNVVEVEKIARSSKSRFHPQLRLLWCQGHDLLTDQEVFVPFEIVHTNYTLPFPDGHGCFVAGSNGLASGNAIIEAISYGICEVIERDAVALWKLSKDRFVKNRLDLTSVNDPICRETIAQLERAGLEVIVWDVTSNVSFAAFACYILPQTKNAMWHSAPSVGYGCHPARHIALLRALTEAAQARLTIIAGLRDDIWRSAYTKLLDPDALERLRNRTAVAEPRRKFGDVPNWEADTFEEDVEHELNCLEQAGIENVIVVDLTRAEFSLPVVRVVVPGLESILEEDYCPGQRARAVLAAA